jgi:hypothetical protein
MPPSPPPIATTGDERLSPTVSVVIPALNEEDNLPLVLEGLPPVDEIVIVDGGSADDTVAIAREMRPDALVVRQTRRGKGNALACGFAASSGDIVVVLNADGSTDPGEIPRYVDALLSGAEVAHGSRFRDGGGDLVGRRLDRIGNALLSRFVNALFGTRFTDLGYGYNAYWRALLPLLDLPPIDAPRVKRGRVQWGDGPEIEPLINIRTAAQGLRVVEVSSVGYPPINGHPERHRLRRALRAMRVAFAEYVRRWRIGRRTAPPDAAPRDAQRAGSVRHGTAGRDIDLRDTDMRERRAALDDTATRLRREALYDTGTRLRLGSPDDTATRLRREQLYGGRVRPRAVEARGPEVSDTGTRIRHQPVSRQRSAPPSATTPPESGARLRAVPSYDTGTRMPGDDRYDTRGRVPADAFHDAGTLSRHQSLYDTGSHLRHDDGAGTGARALPSPGPEGRHDLGSASRRDAGSASRRDLGSVSRFDTGSGSRHDLGAVGRQDAGSISRYDAGSGSRHDLGSGSRADIGTGTGARQPRDERSARPGARRDNGVAAGPWRDLARGPRRGPEGVVRYDPAGDERHDLDPDARRSLPMYPPADPSWTRTSGRHAALTDDAGTGAHHRVEPDRRPTGREVGGRRRRLEPWERRAEGRPDLTVLPGGGNDPAGGDRNGGGDRTGGGREGGYGREIGSRRETGGVRETGASRRWETTGYDAYGWGLEGWERRTPDGGRRPGHLRAIPGERSTR